MSEPCRVADVFRWIGRHPWQAIGRRWNYKSAIASALIRAALFFTTNLTAGLDAALAAVTTELVFRLATAGFYGALTQAFRHAEPRWLATLCTVVLLPAIAHTFELAVHWMRGTPQLAVSITASVIMSIVSTAFNLFAMRRGVLIVGEGRQTLLHDLRAVPGLIWLFIVSTFLPRRRLCP